MAPHKIMELHFIIIAYEAKLYQVLHCKKKKVPLDTKVHKLKEPRT